MNEPATPKRTMREIWAAVRAYVGLQLPEDLYLLNVKPLEAAAYENGRLVLAAPNPQAAEWCRYRFDRIIRRELAHETGRDIAVDYTVAGETQ